MTRPRDLSKDDEVYFDTDGLSDDTFRVSDVEVTDIGITEVVSVTLVMDDDGYKITGTTADSRFTLEPLEGEEEWGVWEPQINLV